MKLGAVEATAPVLAGATHVTLLLDVPAGPARFETALLDERSGTSRGAFYIEIERQEPRSL